MGCDSGRVVCVLVVQGIDSSTARWPGPFIHRWEPTGDEKSMHRGLANAGVDDLHMSATQRRSGHWDWWKGVAILAVIAIHAVGTTTTSDGPFANEFAVVFRQIVNFAVALFLCIAGYFAAKSWRGDAIGYWRSRGWRILPAYLVWTTVAVAVMKPGHFASPRALIDDYGFGLGIGIGYYVIVLLQYVALVPLLARLRSTAQHISVMVVTMTIGLTISYVLQIAFAETRWSNFPFNAILFIVWAPFFQLGFWAGRNPGAIKSRSDGLWLWLAALTVLAAVAEGFYWDSRGIGLAQSQIKASSFLVSIFVALHVIATRETQRSGPVAAGIECIGRSSYMIYLSHMLFLPTITAAVRISMPALYSFRPAALLVATTLAAALCIALAFFIRKLTRPVIYRDLLGIG